jgi:hypothetical protein
MGKFFPVHQKKAIMHTFSGFGTLSWWYAAVMKLVLLNIA